MTRRGFAKLGAGAIAAGAAPQRYQPDWASLDLRPNPAWFDDAKIGVSLHWSVFSVPAIAWVYPDQPYGWGGHSCWYGIYIDRIYPLRPEEQARLEDFHRRTYGNVSFRELAPLFKAEAYEPQRRAELFVRSGTCWASSQRPCGRPACEAGSTIRWASSITRCTPSLRN
jgi:alpha-L-fucosidase